MTHHIKLHANKFIALLSLTVFVTALMVLRGDLIATGLIKWADVIGEGGGALMVLTWFFLVLLGRPRGQVTNLLAFGLGSLFLGMWVDALDEFYKLPATIAWGSAIESVPNLVGWVVTTVGIYVWHREQLAINRALRTRESDVRDHRQFDALTPVSRMAYFAARADEVRSSGSVACVIDIDLIGFRHLNAQYGADACDLVLQMVGELLALNLRNGDLVCRKGGDHFSVLLPDTTLDTANAMALELRTALESTCFRDEHGHRMEVWIRSKASPLTPAVAPGAIAQVGV